MRCIAAFMLFASLAANAQAPIEQVVPPPLPAPAGCGDALLVSADHYDFTRAADGNSGSVEWIHCDTPKLSYSLGLSAHKVADSKWQLARGSITFRPLPERIFYANLNTGSGDSSIGGFDFLTVTEGAIVKAAARLYLKAEHQYFHIGATRGNLARLAGIVTLAPAVTAEINVTRSFDSSLSIRSSGLRLDWDAGSARPFVGAASGRQIPQAFEIAAGTPAPAFTNRQWFTGVSLPFKRLDWILAFDYQSGEATSRRTFTSALRFALK